MSLHSPYGFWISQPSYQRVRNRLYSQLIPKGTKSILEVGAGKGELAYYCRGRGIEYVGIEPNEFMCNRLVSQGFEVYPYTAKVGIVNGFVVGRDRQQCILMAHVIEHLPPEEILELFKSIRKREVAQSMILLYPDIEKCGDIFYQDYTHVFPTTKKRVENMLTDCGYTIEKSGYYCGPFTCPFMVTILSIITWVIPFWLLSKRLEDDLRARTQVCAYTIGRI